MLLLWAHTSYPFLFLNAPHWMHWRATPACLGFIQWRMTECWPLLIYATKPCGGQLYRIFTFCACKVTRNSFIIQVLSWMPEELPASSVASSASAIHHLHPRTTDCWTRKHTHENAGICSWIDLLPFIECPTIQSSSVSFYMSKSHHTCLSPFLSTFLKLGKQRDAVKQRLCITKVLAGSSQHLPSCLCSNWSSVASPLFPRWNIKYCSQKEKCSTSFYYAWIGVCSPQLHSDSFFFL